MRAVQGVDPGNNRAVITQLRPGVRRRRDATAVLVTGSSGRVGEAVAAAASAAGWAVRGCDRVPGLWTTLVSDLRDPQARRAALAGVQAVVHVAALHAPHVGHVPHSEFRAVNVDLTGALLAEAAAAGAARFVYTSSTSVYGHALAADGQAVWVDELLIPRPRDIYDETKLAAEGLVLTAGTPAAVLRIARCFPEPPEVLARHRLHRGVALSDVAAAHVLALQRGHVTGVFNIAGPLLFEPGDAASLSTRAAAVIRCRSPAAAAAFSRMGWSLPGQIDRVYDSRAAGAALGYHPAEDVASLVTARPLKP
jgi:nucleoside-diphosphate-sugar epimerase